MLSSEARGVTKGASRVGRIESVVMVRGGGKSVWGYFLVVGVRLGGIETREGSKLGAVALKKGVGLVGV